jgi:CelD/BcsL family acetyltransferase involved in cellulose biosynthesis
MPAGSSTSKPLRIRVVTSASEFARLSDDWERLQEKAAVTSVFASFDWQYLWWQTYGKEQPLLVLLAMHGDELVGILPLYVQTVPMLRYPVRLLRLIGSGGDTWPDDLGPILAEGYEAEAARELAQEVMRISRWDVLFLTDMDPSSAFTSAVQVASTAAHLECHAEHAERIVYTALPATWEAWLQSMSGDRRYRIRNARKKLHAAHSARFFVWTDPATLDQGIDRLVHLHHKRWKQAEQSHSFATPEYIGFHRAVMAACLNRDRLRLYCLELSGEIVAMFYFYRFRNRVYLMQSGFDPDHSKVKPGQVLLGHVVEHAIGEGNEVLDFLRGDHQYKEEIATGERKTVNFTALRFRPGALVYRTRRMYLPELKARALQLAQRMRKATQSPSERAL